MIFWRRKSLDLLIADAEKQTLRRSLGAFQLTMLGIGAIIGTGIFVLIAEAAQKAGPGMMVSFVIAGFVCGVTALCFAELASMVPVSGSAYTYSYAVMGEAVAWVIGWSLVLEYAISGSAVAVGWSGYTVGLVENMAGIDIPDAWTRAPASGGLVNLPAMLVSLAVTGLLVVGTSASARFNAILVIVKIVVLSIFVALTVPVMDMAKFEPFAPAGGLGIGAAAASIFFAYVGFDAVSTAAEETRNPQRNVPIGLIGSLIVCTIFYLLVAAGAIGTVGAQPIMGADGAPLPTGSSALTAACQGTMAFVCSSEPLAYVLRASHRDNIGTLLSLAAGFALPSVVLMMIYGQTRIFFVMARDGLLPQVFAKVHPRFRTPHVVTWSTGLFVAFFAGFFPIGLLADISNSGTLLAFLAVALAVMILRVREPDRPRGFRTPGIWIIGPLAVIGCAALFLLLSWHTILLFLGWSTLGLIFYRCYGFRHSRLARQPLTGEGAAA